MAKSGLAKKLPKRTGKPQKVRMMENSHRRSEVKKAARRTANATRHNVNRLALIAAFGTGYLNDTTKTQRRKYLADVRGSVTAIDRALTS